MASVPSHSALETVHMEKTPRRSNQSPAASSRSASSGSVVVDPSSQLPGGPASHRGTDGSGATRRKAETTLVLQARKVDTLRRQVLQRQRAQVRGRRWNLVLWGLAGAGAVLLGGWLATRLSPGRSDGLEAPLVLGRSESDGAPALAPPDPVDAQDAQPQSTDQDTSERAGRRWAGNRRGAGAVPSGAPAGEVAQASSADAEARAGSARSPDEPKVVGDWGDGFDNHEASTGRRPRAGSDAVNLDDLPTE